MRLAVAPSLWSGIVPETLPAEADNSDLVFGPALLQTAADHLRCLVGMVDGQRPLLPNQREELCSFVQSLQALRDGLLPLRQWRTGEDTR